MMKQVLFGFSPGGKHMFKWDPSKEDVIITLTGEDAAGENDRIGYHCGAGWTRIETERTPTINCNAMEPV